MPSDRTIERCLADLAEEGYLVVQPRGNKKYYRLAPDPFAALSQEQLRRLACAVSFHRNVLPPATCGHYLLDILRHRLEQPDRAEDTDLFQFQHQHLGQILDDDSLWILLRAMAAGETVSFLYHGRTHHTISQVYPARILSNETTGRRYLFGIYLGEGAKTPALYRLDKIRTPQPTGVPAVAISQAEIRRLWDDALSFSFTGVFCHPAPPTEIVLGLMPDHGAPSLPRGFTALEMRGDTLRIRVNSFSELKPWLFSHLEQVEIRQAPPEDLAESQQELREWRSLYDIDPSL